MKKQLVAVSIALGLLASAATSQACTVGFSASTPAQTLCTTLAEKNRVSDALKTNWITQCVSLSNEYQTCKRRIDTDPNVKNSDKATETMSVCQKPISDRICSLPR